MATEFQKPKFPASEERKSKSSTESGYFATTRSPNPPPLFSADVSESTDRRDPFSTSLSSGTPVNPEAGAVLERQFLLSEPKPRVPLERLVRLLSVALIVMTLVALSAGGFLLYRSHEQGWGEQVDGVRRELTAVQGENDRLTREAKIAAGQLAKKTQEHAEAAQLASRTVAELKTSLEESRALRRQVEELKAKNQRLQRTQLGELGSLVPKFLRDTLTWRTATQTLSWLADRARLQEATGPNVPDDSEAPKG